MTEGERDGDKGSQRQGMATKVEQILYFGLLRLRGGVKYHFYRRFLIL